MTAGPSLMSGVRNRRAHVSQVHSSYCVLAHSRTSKYVLEETPLALNVETGSNELNSRRATLSPNGGEHKKTRSTVSRQRNHRTDDTMIQETQVTTRAASRNSKAMVKGPDKTHTKWKCRTKGDVAPSGPSARISQMGRCPDPGPIGKGESWQAEGIEKIHMKLWKCRIGGCNKTFHRKGDAVRHVQTTARHNGKAVVCSCGAPFSRHDALKRHQRLCNEQVS
jgi:hypothetical protein